MTPQNVRKAIVAVVGAAVAVAAVFGTSIDPKVVNSVVGAITTILVYAIPNDL